MKKDLAPKKKPALIEIFESVLGNGGVLPEIYKPAIDELTTEAIIWKVNYEGSEIKVTLYEAQKAYYAIYKKMHSGFILSQLFWKLLLSIAGFDEVKELAHYIEITEKIRQKITPEKTQNQ